MTDEQKHRVSRKRGFCIYQKDKGKRKSNVHIKHLSPVTCLSRVPLRETNINVTSLFGHHKDRAIRPLNSNDGKCLLSTFSFQPEISSQNLPSKKLATSSINTILDDSKVSSVCSNDMSLEKQITKRPHIQRLISQMSKSNDGHSFTNSSSLLAQLSNALCDLNMQIQISKNDKDYNRLLSLKSLKLLSPNELLVITDDDGTNDILILHSNDPIKGLDVDKLSDLKLAINSKRYLRLYNDIIWHIRWKFI